MQINNNGLNCVLICDEMLSLSSRMKRNGKSFVSCELWAVRTQLCTFDGRRRRRRCRYRRESF